MKKSANGKEKTVVLDVYNNMGQLGYFELINRDEMKLPEARNDFLEKVEKLNKAKYKITAVCDGKFVPKKRKRIFRKRRERIKIIFTRRESADHFIKRIAQPNSKIIITDDIGLRRELGQTGVRAFSFFSLPKILR